MKERKIQCNHVTMATPISSHVKDNQRGSKSHLVNPKVYKAKFNLVEVSVNVKKFY